MAGFSEGECSGGGVEHFALADKHGVRMRALNGRLFNVCSELVEIGMMSVEERDQRLTDVQAHPGLIHPFLEELDPGLESVSWNALAPQHVDAE